MEISKAFYAAAKICDEKDKDYGGRENYFPFGDKSHVHEIVKKSNRLLSLVKREVEPLYESIEDNLLDLINYAAFYYEYLVDKNQTTEPTKQENENGTIEELRRHENIYNTCDPYTGSYGNYGGKPNPAEHLRNQTSFDWTD